MRRGRRPAALALGALLNLAALSGLASCDWLLRSAVEAAGGHLQDGSPQHPFTVGPDVTMWLAESQLYSRFDPIYLELHITAAGDYSFSRWLGSWMQISDTLSFANAIPCDAGSDGLPLLKNLPVGITYMKTDFVGSSGPCLLTSCEPSSEGSKLYPVHLTPGVPYRQAEVGAGQSSFYSFTLGDSATHWMTFSGSLALPFSVSLRTGSFYGPAATLSGSGQQYSFTSTPGSYFMEVACSSSYGMEYVFDIDIQ